MQVKTSSTSWNELQFLSWTEFTQMAPSILQLEVTRLGKIIQTSTEDTEFHNNLIRGRYELKQFISCLKRAEKETLEETCGKHLRSAIMSMTLQPENLDDQTKKTCRYVLDRLNYVYHRIRLIY